MAVFPQAPVLFNTDPNWTAAQARVEFERWLAASLQLPGAAEAEALTIATGQITPTRASVIVDTEGGTSADDLTTIATTNMHAGAVLMLCAANSGRTVTVKHGTGAGGIALLGGVDCALSTTHWLMLRRVGDAWAEMPPLRAAQAQQAATAAACTGNAATATLAAAASDMAAGHVLAGKKTAEAVRTAIAALSPDVGRWSCVLGATGIQTIAAGVSTTVQGFTAQTGENWGTADGTLGITVPETGVYDVEAAISVQNGTPNGYGYALIAVSGLQVAASLAYAPTNITSTMKPSCTVNAQAGDKLTVSVVIPNGGTISTGGNRVLTAKRVR